MRIMILGGCGFIGSHVADLLHKDTSNKLFIFDDMSTGKHENVRHLISTKFNTRIIFDQLDVRNRSHVDDAFCRFRPEVVILLAAQAAISVSENDPWFDATTNVNGMLNVISASKQFGTRRIVFSSTSAVYREKRWGKLKETDFCAPRSPYGISKLAAEHYLRTLFPESMILRFGNVFGPRQVSIGGNQVIPRMIRHFLFGDEFQIYGDGKQTRDYIYVEDVAEAVACATMIGKSGTYNIASGKRLSVLQVARALEEVYQLPKNYPWELSTQVDPRKDICLNIRKAQENLGWEPRVSFREGLKRTVEWWKTPQEPRILVKTPIAYEEMR